MNFNFKIIDLENIVFTLSEMKTGIYVLVSMAGIHTLTLLFWFGYKYLNKNKQLNQIKLEELNEIIEELDQLNQESKNQELDEIIEELDQLNQESKNQELDEIIEELDQLNDQELNDQELDEKKIYHSMVTLENNKDELEKLLNRLSSIQNSLEVVREKLSEIHNSPTI